MEYFKDILEIFYINNHPIRCAFFFVTHFLVLSMEYRFARMVHGRAYHN
jgi:hypothetical protein